MPIENFDDDCFVAFTDISGFKEMMKDDQRAIRAIDRFYSAGYTALQECSNINGFFISDCGVLFSREGTQERQLEDILGVIREVNRVLRSHGIMLTTSIAWGRFSFRNRIRFVGIEKQAIYGNAYTRAYLDNEAGKPKIEPGQCRIVRQGVEERVFRAVQQRRFLEPSKRHVYFYWMLNRSADIEKFKKRYRDSYQLKYAGMLDALR